MTAGNWHTDGPMRRTKIVATLGPASASPEHLAALIEAGVDVVRLNLSHGTVDEHLARLAAVRAESIAQGRPIAVLADLPGPKVRAGAFPTEGVQLVEGSTVRLMPGQSESDASLINVDYPNLVDDLAVGDRIVIGDGAITLRVTAHGNGWVDAQVRTGGRTSGRPGVHLATTRFRVSSPTERDLELAVIMAKAGVDFLAVSFVRSGFDVRQVRTAVGQVATGAPRLVAKIETEQAVGNLDEILDASDAIMVARGDLGIDCDLADVPHLQKKIIRACVEAGIPVITATQMLETMITAPSPTRAEVSDVANAVFDGTDAVMLSGETAVGHDPSLVVRTMAEICERAEREASYRAWANALARRQRLHPAERGRRITDAISHAAWQAAEDVGAAAVLCCTTSGRTALAMSRCRPLSLLVGVSPEERTVRSLCLSWGIRPVLVDLHADTDDMIWFAVEAAARHGLIATGDVVVVLAGTPDQAHRATDVLRVVEIA